MSVEQLAHVCLHVRDVEKTMDFYSRVLGLPVKFKFLRADDNSVKGAYFEAGNGTFIEFFETDRDRAGESPIVHLCLQVDDIEATIENVRAAEWEISDRKLGSDQSWQAWITDPDGTRIELHEYTRNSSQNTGRDLTVSW